MPKKRTETLLTLIVLGVVLIPVAVLGLWGYVTATTRPLHPDAEAVGTVARPSDSPRWSEAAKAAHEIARAGLVAQNLPGLSVAVGAGGEIVWAEGLGWANVDARLPVTPDTRFRIGNASIALTSAAAGLLLEDGRLKLDDEIHAYVPAYPEKQWPVTVRQLMAHTGGVRPDNGDEEPLAARCGDTLGGLPRFAGAPLQYEPGTRYRFSSYGWILVSAAVERAADEPFFSVVRKRVFEPLGMKDTGADAPSEPLLNPATFYFPRFAADPRYGPQPPREDDYSCLSGAAAFITTPSDLVRFGLAMTRGRLLRPETVSLLQTSQRLPSGEETGYGLGWDLETVTVAGGETRWIGHDGEMMGGTVASFMTFPQYGLVVAVLSNTAYADTPALAVRIADVFARAGGGNGGS